jgi:hypothetical protein
MVSFFAHPEPVFVPGLRPPSRDRRAAIEAIRYGDGPYVTAVVGEGQPVTKKATAADLEGLMDYLANQAIKNNSRARLNVPKPKEPERSPRAASDDIFRQVTGHFPRNEE